MNGIKLTGSQLTVLNDAYITDSKHVAPNGITEGDLILDSFNQLAIVTSVQNRGIYFSHSQNKQIKLSSCIVYRRLNNYPILHEATHEAVTKITATNL